MARSSRVLSSACELGNATTLHQPTWLQELNNLPQPISGKERAFMQEMPARIAGRPDDTCPWSSSFDNSSSRPRKGRGIWFKFILKKLRCRMSIPKRIDPTSRKRKMQSTCTEIKIINNRKKSQFAVRLPGCYCDSRLVWKVQLPCIAEICIAESQFSPCFNQVYSFTLSE